MDADEALLADLRRALEEARSPAAPRSMADAAWAWRHVDAELATIAYDSLEEDLAGVRAGSSSPRVVVFETAGASVEVERGDNALVGQLVPPGEGEVTVYGPTDVLARARADELGCFHVPLHHTGPVRLRCRTSSVNLVTDWIRF